MYLSLTEDQKRLIDEISALSGIQKNVIREVWEFTLIRWAESIAKDPTRRAELDIPFLGKISVKYEGDFLESDGCVTTSVSGFIALSPIFRKLVGDIHDEGSSLITTLLEKKIENATITTTANLH